MLEVGKTYELNSGDVHECTRTFKRPDGEVVYVLDEVWYHQDGTCGCFENMPDSRYHVRRCVDDTPTLWRDMTDAEKGALLLAHYEGKVIQYSWECDTKFHDFSDGGYPIWNDKVAYRIKPEPKVETVVLYGSARKGNNSKWGLSTVDFRPADTHRITFNIIDRKPDPASIKMEEL